MAIPPTLILALLVGALHASLSLLIRGGLARHLLVVLPGALVGAVAGTAFSLRIADPIRIGDVGLVWASAGAWAGIIGASLLARIVQGRRARPT